ncbi:protein of unknown function [Ruminococcaceae bacterium BL-4]|nr:protein of unknown function [Ruminococcaceae bacterium BL-4]
MGDLKTMSEAEIIARKDNYLKGLNDLMDKLFHCLLKQRHSQAEKNEIKTKYRNLKSRIGEESKILRIVKRSIRYISRTHANYEGGIVEADAKYKVNKYFN